MLGKLVVPAKSARTPTLIQALSETELLRAWNFNKSALCALDGFRPNDLAWPRIARLTDDILPKSRMSRLREEGAAFYEHGHADRPASSARTTHAGSAYRESAKSGRNGKSGNRPPGCPLGQRRRKATPEASASQRAEGVPGSTPQSPRQMNMPMDIGVVEEVA